MSGGLNWLPTKAETHSIWSAYQGTRLAVVCPGSVVGLKSRLEPTAMAARRLDIVLLNKKKRTCHLVNFTIQADNGVKMKDTEKIFKYLDFARELKKQWNMKITVIPIIVDAVGMVPKDLERRLEEKSKLSWPRLASKIFRRILETRGNFLLSEKPAIKSGVKNSHRVII